MPTGQGQPSPSVVAVLAVDTELGRHLAPAERADAERRALGARMRLTPGAWDPRPDGRRGHGALLVLDGLLVRRVAIGDELAIELLGAGDVMMSVPRDEPAGFVEPAVTWTVLEATSVAWLGSRFADAARRWPGLWTAMCERVEQRAHRAAVFRAIGQLVRVEDRILVLLWVLSERWGHVTHDGVTVEVNLTHEMIGQLVGARRPSVTTAFTHLQASDTVRRRDAGGWLLTQPPPSLVTASGARESRLAGHDGAHTGTPS